MKDFKLKNSLNNTPPPPPPPPQYAENKELTLSFCILAFFLLYACSSFGSTSILPSTATYKITIAVNKPVGVSATIAKPPSETTFFISKIP